MNNNTTTMASDTSLQSTNGTSTATDSTNTGKLSAKYYYVIGTVIQKLYVLYVSTIKFHWQYLYFNFQNLFRTQNQSLSYQEKMDALKIQIPFKKQLTLFGCAIVKSIVIGRSVAFMSHQRNV